MPGKKGQALRGNAISAYDPDHHPKAAAFAARRGATMAEIASEFGVTTTTLFNWRNRHPELDEAIIRAGLDQFDARIERTLAERASGYFIDVEEPKIAGGAVVMVKYRKYIAPDITAMIFWLKNRHPDKWRDVHEMKHSGQIVSAEDLLAEIKKEMKELGISQSDLDQIADTKMIDVTPESEKV